MPGRRGILIFAEDPGALNLFAELPRALAVRGVEATFLATGHARAVLKAAGAPHVALRRGRTARSVLEEFQPALCLTGTSSDERTLGLRLVEACRERGIPTVGAVDASMNAGRRFAGPRPDEPLRFAPDELLVIDEPTARAFEALGYPRGRITVCGHPLFDRVLDAREAFIREGKPAVRRRALPPALMTRTVVTFVSEGSSRVMRWEGKAGESTWMRGWTGRNGRTELAFETLEPAIRRTLPRAGILFRLHPKDVRSDFEAYAEKVAGFSAGGNPLEAMFASDLVVGTTSMLMAEAALLGVPVLCLVNQRTERAWLPVIGGDDACFASSAAGLDAALRRFGEDGGTPGARIRTRPLRGATARIADFLRRRLSRRRR